MTPSDIRRYSIAAAAVAVALPARYALHDALGDKVPFLQFASTWPKALNAAPSVCSAIPRPK